jgi:hypothetical protein
VSAAIGYSPALVGRVLKGNYKGDLRPPHLSSSSRDKMRSLDTKNSQTLSGFPVARTASPLAGTLLIIFVTAVYFAPALVVSARSDHGGYAIFALDLFLGWTVPGWIAALVWSLTDPARIVPVVSC